MMVVGASTDSKLHLIIAAATAMLADHERTTFSNVFERARFFRELIARAEFPTEEQMLLMAGALPEDAAAMANGVAAIKRVLHTLDQVGWRRGTPVPEDVLLTQYLGTKANLVLGLNYLRGARAEFLAFATSR
jgi:hypothetical protein